MCHNNIMLYNRHRSSVRQSNIHSGNNSQKCLDNNRPPLYLHTGQYYNNTKVSKSQLALCVKECYFTKCLQKHFLKSKSYHIRIYNSEYSVPTANSYNKVI